MAGWPDGWSDGIRVDVGIEHLTVLIIKLGFQLKRERKYGRFATNATLVAISVPEILYFLHLHILCIFLLFLHILCIFLHSKYNSHISYQHTMLVQHFATHSDHFQKCVFPVFKL